MTAFACIATRNEAATIGPLVDALRNLNLRVIVEDESDGADTYAQAIEAGALASWTPGGSRTGLGPSLMRAWRRALGEGASAIVQLDAGGSHDPAEAPRLLNALQYSGVVVGSRFCPQGRYIGRPQRAALSRLAAAACNWRAGRRWWARARADRPTDWTSGYRAFHPRAARWLMSYVYHARGHAWQIETLLLALRNLVPVAEVPITYTAGQSSLRLASVKEALDTWRMI